MRFHATWRYKLKEDFLLEFDNRDNISFSSEWFHVQDNQIRIVQGYSWNGCSPAFMVSSDILGFSFWLGTPDGVFDLDTQLPQSWRASLVHDAFCQYRPEMTGIKKAFTVELFRKLLCDSGFPSWKAAVYSKSVALFGPQDWK